MKKEIQDKRKINYVLVVFSIVFLLAELFKINLRFEVLGIFMLFLIAFFNTDGKVKIPYEEEEEKKEKTDVEPEKKKSDPIALICALLAVGLTLITIFLYFI